LVGSLILGLIWALWHLPIFWVPAWNLPPTILNIVMFVIAAIAFTVVMTWVLRAHLLNLRCLLFQGCSERLNFLLLLYNSRLEVFPLL